MKADKLRKEVKSRIDQALLGAILVHPLLFLPVFAFGAFAGASSLKPFTTSQEPIKYGLQGGLNALGYVFLVYLGSCGFVPLIVSVVGAVLARRVGQRFWSMTNEEQITKKDCQAKPGDDGRTERKQG